MNEETLSKVRKMSALMYTHVQIAEVLGLDRREVESLMADTDSDFYKAFTAGFYDTDMPLRNSIKTLALSGSSPAQYLLRKLQEEMEIRRVYE